MRRSSSNGKCDAGILVRREWRTEDKIRTRIRTGGEIKGGGRGAEIERRRWAIHGVNWGSGTEEPGMEFDRISGENSGFVGGRIHV